MTETILCEFIQTHQLKLTWWSTTVYLLSNKTKKQMRAQLFVILKKKEKKLYVCVNQITFCTKYHVYSSLYNFFLFWNKPLFFFAVDGSD